MVALALAVCLSFVAIASPVDARPIPPPSGARRVTPGAFCALGDYGEIGQTNTGLGMTCIPTSSDERLRWRELDSSLYPQVGKIDRLYSAYFLRVADGSGFAYWFGLYTTRGYSLAAISSNFAGSNEFRSRYGQLSTSNFIRRVYLNVLEREPDPDGYNHWARQLGSGRITRGQMVAFFSESPEYKAKTGTV